MRPPLLDKKNYVLELDEKQLATLKKGLDMTVRFATSHREQSAAHALLSLIQAQTGEEVKK